MKVVINTCFGGFGLSKKAYEYLGLPWDEYGFKYRYTKEDRTDPKLIKCVETLGADANGYFADLKVVKIPDDIEWEITDYDGAERIEEVHRIWE